jgi:hypothetical protein
MEARREQKFFETIFETWGMVDFIVALAWQGLSFQYFPP